jgi:hypothetical protein
MDVREAALWLYVVLVSLVFGGALFERLVLVSAWSSAPPRSIRDWNLNPALKLDPGRYFRFVTPPLMVLAPVMLYITWSTDGAARTVMLMSTGATIVALIATFAYYLPTLTHITMRQGEGLDDGQLVRKARRWVALQYVRLALVAFAWLTALCAFRAGA